MKFITTVSVLILVVAGPVIGSSIHSRSLRPKAECGIDELANQLGKIQLKISHELEDGAQAAKDLVGNIAEFDKAIDKMVDHSYRLLLANFNTFFFLQQQFPYDLCEYGAFVFSLWAHDFEFGVDQAAKDIAGLAYAKSPEHYEMVLAEFAKRIEVIKQDIHDAEAVVRDCREALCPIKLGKIPAKGAAPASGGLANRNSTRRISLHIRPKAECDVFDLFTLLVDLYTKIEAEMLDAIASARDTVSGPGEFDGAFNSFYAFNAENFALYLNICQNLFLEYPLECDQANFVLHLYGVHATTLVERAGNTLAAMAFLKSSELYEVIKADVAPRIALVLQDIADAEAQLEECGSSWCEY